MAKGMYAIVNGKNRPCKKAFTIVDGVNRKVKKIFVVKDGVYKECWSGGYPDGQQIFTSSGTWIAPFTGTVEVFMVNGGSSGGASHFSTNTYLASGTGGNGGNTLTQTFNVVKGQAYPIIVGAGGAKTDVNTLPYLINVGGQSSFNSVGAAINSAEDCSYAMLPHTGRYIVRQVGGSGGSPCNIMDMSADNYITFRQGIYGGVAGSDGNNSGLADVDSIYTDVYKTDHINKGQGTTTKAFGESTGTCYSGGGGKGQLYYKNMGDNESNSVGTNGGGAGGTVNTDSLVAYSGSSATANTGSGGGGGGVCANTYYDYPSGASYSSASGAGGSGIVIVRWKDQEEN